MRRALILRMCCGALAFAVLTGCGSTASSESTASRDSTASPPGPGESPPMGFDGCSSFENMGFDVTEREKHPSPDAALEEMAEDMHRPVEEFPVVEAEAEQHMWEGVNADGDVVARIWASRTQADQWWISGAQICYRKIWDDR